ncbi:Vesicle-associated membrane protein-associated protein A [Orchesella cincta]|uniref:Vesicle-associated membrane protein-associated protein A n=1 Tax=Orchesella cincta TaxID=48709 RepID=A0A1D2NF69_ORCCI|nr:Vesicle-associated membrane protein-associated protein A [Orchesella cincta]
MPEQVLKIEPEHELKFKGPFTVPTTSLLKLANPSEKRVCFKIKTTAPKRYCVRPNAGILEPGQSISIAVVFQPCELDSAANKHKFMVQSLYAPDGEVNMDAMWKDVDGTKLMDTKLRCAFEMPMDAASQNDLNAVQEEKISRSKADEVTATSKSHKGDGGVDPNATAFHFAVSSPHASYGSDDSRGTGDASGKVQQEALQLKNENTQLRDELERLRKQMKQREAGGSIMQMGTSASPPAVPMLYIVLALVAALVGLILGKFIV